MKKFTFLSILLMSFFLGIVINVSSQTTIWSEDFSTYLEGTGIEGPGAVNIGDYPAGVTKWTLDVSGCTLSNANDYIKTDYEKLKSKDLEGPAVWLSESIDLSAYSNGATFNIKFYEYSSMEPEDYIDVHYQLDGGDFVLIPNWNGHGSDIHTLIDDFSKDTVVQSVSTCNNLVIKVTFNNNSDSEEFQMDGVFVYPNMEYSSSTTTQNTHNIAAGKTNRQLIGMEIITTGTESPISITQFTINANGSSTPVSNNIENAKIFYTGTDNTFATGTQFGSTYALPTTTNFDITGTQQLSEGTNYFWLTFDTKTGATMGELIDAECILFVIDGSTETPTITDPAGSRTIAAPLSGNYTIGAKSNYASFTAAVIDLNNLGISGSVSFSVASGTYTEQISFSAIDGTSATDTIVFQSSTSNYADVTLQFTQTSTANYVVNFDGSDYVSFLDMTIQSTGSSSYGKVFVFKGTTQNITLKDNNIIGRNINSDSDDYIVIFGEGGTSNMSTNINIENDTVRYGSKGISFEGGDASNLETGNSFRNNAVEDFYYYGIETGYQDAVVINRNTITGKVSSSSGSGIIVNGCNNAIELTQNKVFLNATSENIGIFLYNCIGTAANSGLTANNYISFEEATTTTEGIGIQDCGYQNIYHNSINIRSSSKNTAGNRTGNQTGVAIEFWWTDPLFGHINLLNNIFSNTSGSKAVSVAQTAADNGYLENSDNNDLHTTGATLGDWGSTSCADLAAWYLASGLDGNSVSENPNYISNESPAIGNQNLKESVPELPSVPLDIDNMPRRTQTTPGAKKFCFVWVGTESSDWNNPINWCSDQVPTLDDDICIDAMATYQPDLLSDAEMRDLLMQYGSSLNANNYNMSVYGNANISESNITNDNQLIFGGGENTEFMPGTQRYNDLRINKDSDDKLVAVYCPRDTLKLVKLSVLKGKLEALSVSVSRDADFSGGTVEIGEITLTDAENANLRSGSNTLQSVVVNKSGGGQLTLQDALAAAALQILNGNLDANNKNIEISGNTADLSGGTVTNTSTVELTSNNTVQFNPGNNTFNNLSFTGNGTYEIMAKTIVEGDFLSSGTLNANENDFEFWSNVNLNGTFQNNTGTSTLEFKGNNTQIINFGTNPLYGFAIGIYKGGDDVTDDIHIEGDNGYWLSTDVGGTIYPKRNKGSYSVEFDIDIICNGDFTIGTPDADSVTVNIYPGKTITVTGTTTINNSGNLVLKSDATGTASFIDNGTITGSGSSNITVERYLTDGKWHFVTSPVNNATVNSLFFNWSPDVWLKKFNESASVNGDWEYISELTTPMPFGKGFACWVNTAKENVTANFTGSLRTTDLTLTTSTTPALSYTDAAHGFNLVGNPFASALDWDAGSWDTTNIEGSIWIWDPAGAGSYKYRNAQGLGNLTDGIIPISQAFFIRTKTAAPSFTIPTDARVHSNQAYYKNSKGNKDNPPYIILNVEKDINNDEIWICFTEEGTYGFDNGWDVSKLFSSSESPQLYLQEPENKYSIDVLPPITEEERLIAMGFIAGTEGTHKIIAASLEYMPKTDIILEDLKTGIFQKLNDNPEYSFTGTPEDDPDRFLVHFYNLSFGIDNPNVNENNKKVNIYSYDKTVYIKCEGEIINQTGTIRIYDMYGRQLINKGLEPNNINRIYVPVSNSYLIVKVIKDGGVYTGKVFIR